MIEKGTVQVSTEKWQKTATLLLIDQYKKYDGKMKSGLLTKKVMWDKVSTELKSKGFNYSPDQVQGRWKSLARGYKNVKDHNQKSGNDRKCYEYEDQLDDLFGNDPKIVPKVTTSSLKRSRITIGDIDKDDADSNVTSSSENKPRSEKKQKKSNDSFEFIKCYIERQEERDRVEAERRE